MKLPKHFPGKSVMSLGKFKCKQCGLCCFIQVNMNQSGKQFIPTPQTIQDVDQNQRDYLSLQMCESFDQETRECKDYDNRPEQCRQYSCKGKPRPQILNIAGIPRAKKEAPRIITP